MSTRVVSVLAGLLLGLSVGAPASASSFAVNPVRTTLSVKQGINSLTVRNDGVEPEVIQSEVLAWAQDGGNDVFAPSKDILVTPPIFTIPAGGVQVIRVGLRRAVDAEKELTYRLFLQSVPPPPKPGAQGMQVTLRLSLPVFVLPAAAPAPKIEWVGTPMADGGLKIRASNRGNVHVQIFNLKLDHADGAELLGKQHLAAYLLAGESCEWVFGADKLDPATRARSVLRLLAESDAGDLNAELADAGEATR